MPIISFALLISGMSSSSFIKLLLFTTLLISHKPITAQDDPNEGFHGYEREALMALKQVFNNSFLHHNWTSLMCYMNDVPYWYGIQCRGGRVTGLILENMELTGEIEANTILNLTELSTLSFRNNSLSGSFMDFGDNQNLRAIDLSSNNFHGNIPISLLNLNSLESLQLQNNNFTGPIPAFTQVSLKMFNVSNNNLSAKIPQTTTLGYFNDSSYSGNENLCGPPTTTNCTAIEDTSESDNKNNGKKNNGSWFTAILIGVDVVVIVVILILFIIYYTKYKKLRKEMRPKSIVTKDEEHDSRIEERVTQRRIFEGVKGKLVFVDDDDVTKFELDDLLKASAEGLGKGNFGNCYKAMMEVGPPVVVKRLRDLKPLNSEEFLRQVKAIADQKHPNLMPLLAYYNSKDEKLFLYRFAAHGNVFNRLHGKKNTRERVPFRWSSRLTVARGVARALEHLHQNTRSQTTAPHGNLKSTNVLLDENEEPMVTDYGLSSLISLPIAAQRMVSYKTPEYNSHKRISKKSDMWSYGCLLLELLTGQIPSHSAPPGTSGVELCSWVHRAVREEWTAEIFDPEIAVQRGANQGMLRLMQIAMRCCEKLPDKRPEIGIVVAEVEAIKVVVTDSEEDGEYSYNSSFDRSYTDDSIAATVSTASDRR